jgi:hypothetical protein
MRGFLPEITRRFSPRQENHGRGQKHRAKFKRLRASVVAALALFAFLCPANAQAPRPGELAGRFTVFSARPITDISFAPRTAAPKQKLVFYPTARSPRYDYRSAMPLRFYDETTGIVVAEAVIPLEMKDALLLFSPIEPAPSSGLRYRIAVLDETGLRSGPSGLTIINLSGLALTGTVGNETVALEAGLNPTIAVASATKVVLRTSAKGRSLQSYADTVLLKKDERALLLIFPPFYKGSLEVQSRLLVEGTAPSPAQK